ncbi:MAG TPA: hypothetical protein VG328_22185 [Stellaceae bacterium]|jgi:hypothetical protein|nr:hypothetical protein [Stellaceae bacterium]
MTRALALPCLLLLASCSGLTPVETQGTAFQNPQTGQIVTECGPMQGFEDAIDEAQKGCTDSYKSAGWRPALAR